MVKNRRVSIRNHTAEANLFARRAFITLGVVIVMLLILFNNAYNLQVDSYQQYQTRSNSNRIKLLPVAPNRGLIYDRNGVLLAENRPVYSLEVIPEQVDDIEETIEHLSELFEINDDKKAAFLKRVRSKRRFKPVEIISRLSDEQVAKFSVNQHLFPGVFIDARLKRYYPFGELTTHSLGYVARINRRDAIRLEEQNKSETYAATRDIGKLGLEKYYEEMLHGQVGNQEVEVNNKGRVIRTLNFTPPIPGKDLTLTLDIELQMIAKRSLTGRRGAVVAIDPRDGGVLSMYSNPSYDGNLFVHGISTKNYKKLLESKNLPLINRTVQGYPPASTIKPFIALLGLEEKMITPSTRVWDPGWFQIENVEKRYRDWKKWGHGWVDLSKSLEQSCNVYYYDLAYKLGITKISDLMAKFGFGDYTGVDIHEESDGILPSVGWKRARYNQPWYAGETVSVGIGQSYWSVTPLQLAQATSILVNKGEIKVPHLLKSTREQSAEDQNQFIDSETEMKPPVVLKAQKNWDHVLDAMHNTVQKEGATGFNAFRGSDYDAAGKTGSAQVASIGEDEEYEAEKIQENKRDNAMFIAFAPYDNPEIVVAVAIENVAKGGGALNAAPVARQMMDQYFGNRFSEDQIAMIGFDEEHQHFHAVGGHH